MSHTKRVVVLVDMDCFYCQVEENLKPSLKGKPIAVVQHNIFKGGGIIAVNYPAREKGVTRHMRGDDARSKCPDIQLVKVPIARGKADMSKYREAGKRVVETLQNFTQRLERASIDEAYLDITELVDKRLKETQEQITSNQLLNTHVVGYSVQDFINEVYRNTEVATDNLKLLMGGVITEEIRAAVLLQTGYKCSAGIAHNKILAKLACGLHKPDQQTILPQASVPIFYSDLPVKKVRGLGGKFGYVLSMELGITNMSELIDFSESDLIQKFDQKTGLWLYNIARGIDNDPVTTKLISKSIGCSKKFAGSSTLIDLEDVEHWVNELASELSERLKQDTEENCRKATKIIFSFARILRGKEVTSSRVHLLNSYDADKIAQDALDVVKRFCQGPGDGYSVKFLGMSAINFENIERVKNITSFFKPTPAKENKDTPSKENKDTPSKENKDTPSKEDKDTPDKENKDTPAKENKDTSAKENKDTKTKGSQMTKTLEGFQTTKTKRKDLPFSKRQHILKYFESMEPSTSKQGEESFSNDDSLKSDNSEIVYAASTPSPIKEDENLMFYDELDRRVPNNSQDSSDKNYRDPANSSTTDMDQSTSTPSSKKTSSSNYSEDSITNEMNRGSSSTVSSDESKSFFASFFNKLKISRDFDTSKGLDDTGDSTSSSNDSGPTEPCPLCGKPISIAKMAIHKERHLAEEMAVEKPNLCKPIPIRGKPPHKKSKKGKRKATENVDTLLSYVEKDDEGLTEENSQVCNECNKRVKTNDFVSHKDRHVAKRLHEELNPRPQTSTDDHPSSSKKSKSTKKQSCQGSLKSFFRPKSPSDIL